MASPWLFVWFCAGFLAFMLLWCVLVVAHSGRRSSPALAGIIAASAFSAWWWGDSTWLAALLAFAALAELWLAAGYVDAPAYPATPPADAVPAGRSRAGVLVRLRDTDDLHSARLKSGNES